MGRAERDRHGGANKNDSERKAVKFNTVYMLEGGTNFHSNNSHKP